MNGRIIEALSGFYYVETDNGIIECRARGRFRNDGTSPLVGDIVEIHVSGGMGSVDRIMPRNNFLLRPPISNIDILFIVSSSVTPSPNLLLIDRITALCEYKHITPIIVFNKNDMGDVSDLVKIYRSAGYDAFECSAKTGEGREKFEQYLTNTVCAFTGNSGVGKSSIINFLFPELSLLTGEISEKLGRGRHTTRHTQLFRHKYNGYVADTPGFSSLDIDLYDYGFKETLCSLFPEFTKVDGCRFSDCKHIGESDCAVIKAVRDGTISAERYRSYKTMFEELKDIKPWMKK